ncbi:hypothetical protein EJB05_38104, partial [Eragrostis curvula]
MAMAALREASRCLGLASRVSPAPACSALLAHSRGITYKLFIGDKLIVLALRKSCAHVIVPSIPLQAYHSLQLKTAYRKPSHATIVTDKVTSRPKGFGFVKYASEEEANNAREEMNGKARFSWGSTP